MARAYEFKEPEFKWVGLCSGMWSGCKLDLDRAESAGAAAAAAAGAAALLPFGPGGVALAALVGSYAEELVGKRGPNGVTVTLDVNIANPGCHKIDIQGR